MFLRESVAANSPGGNVLFLLRHNTEEHPPLTNPIEPRRISLHTKILLGLLLGAVGGLAVNLFGSHLEQLAERLVGRPVPLFSWLLDYVTIPLGQVFLRLLLMTVVPLVFASLALGVARLGDMGKLGRVGARTFGLFLLSMVLAVLLSLLLVNLIKPGVDLPEATRQHLLQTYGGATEGAGKAASFGVQTFVAIVPRNPLQAAVQMDMLGVIFFALLFGIGLASLGPQRAGALVQVLDALNEVMVFIINVAMRLAPYGVFALIFTVAARFGFDLLRQLGIYVGVVLLGLGLHLFGTLSALVWLLARLNPLLFFSRVWTVLVTAFSTSSSNATLPTTIKIAEERLGIPPHLAGFVLPLGATMNMNGTALFEGATVVFLAQVFGVPLGVGEQVIVVILAVLTAIGTAGVPGGSIPLLAMVLTAVGVPAEGIAVIIGVDRLLDMCRTTLNVGGDLVTVAYVARAEGYSLPGPGPIPQQTSSL
jgi:DAACS family dicarboxylate/amino acid:cation (Na+ or H+) symporter